MVFRLFCQILSNLAVNLRNLRSFNLARRRCGYWAVVIGLIVSNAFYVRGWPIRTVACEDAASVNPVTSIQRVDIGDASEKEYIYPTPFKIVPIRVRGDPLRSIRISGQYFGGRLKGFWFLPSEDIGSLEPGKLIWRIGRLHVSLSRNEDHPSQRVNVLGRRLPLVYHVQMTRDHNPGPYGYSPQSGNHIRLFGLSGCYSLQGRRNGSIVSIGSLLDCLN